MTAEEDIPEPSVVTTIRIRREQHDRLREIAAREHRSMGGEIRRLIDERIAAYEDRQPAA